MKRSEEIERQSKEFIDNYMQSCVDYRSLGYHQRKAILNVDLYKVKEVYEEAANWAGKTMLDNACEWLSIYYPNIDRMGIDEFITEFRQAMKGGAE